MTDCAIQIFVPLYVRQMAHSESTYRAAATARKAITIDVTSHP
jgi:hypothetical protein